MASQEFKEILRKRSEYWSGIRNQVKKLGPSPGYLSSERLRRADYESVVTQKQCYKLLEFLSEIQLARTDLSKLTEKQLDRLEGKYNEIRDIIVWAALNG